MSSRGMVRQIDRSGLGGFPGIEAPAMKGLQLVFLDLSLECPNADAQDLGCRRFSGALMTQGLGANPRRSSRSLDPDG